MLNIINIIFVIMNEKEMNTEWIITNANGSYSSSTVSFANVRTYHGILVKNISEDYVRMVLLSKIFEDIYLDNQEIHLDTNYYPDVIYPKGYRYITKFNVFPIPTFEYVINGTKIKKSIVIDPDLDNVFINYDINGKIPEKIKFTPLLSFRSNHSTIKKGLKSYKLDISDIIKIESDGIELKILVPGKFFENEDWYYNFQYPVDKERGLNHEEDLFTPGYFLIEKPLKKFTLEISAMEITKKSFNDVKERYIKRLKSVNGRLKNMEFASNLVIARDNIIAGYYWFGAWARDALISIPGLLLTEGRYDEALNILIKYAKTMRNGIIPREYNKMDDYITADTSLWFIYAVYKYYTYTKNKNDLSKLYTYVKNIVNAYISGNEKFELDHNFVRVKDAPLTWMDANYGGNAFTPRIGLPVEVNALWYNALSTLEFFGQELNIKTEPGVVEIKSSIKSNFQNKFISDGKVLDVSEPDDDSTRPNFIFAFSLPFPIMNNFNEYKKLVDSELLTPFGLRTLSPKDPKFKPKYEGDWYSRDSAYHNGTVWPWLVGPYITASIRSGESAKKLFKFFRPLYNLIYIPEIFDGIDPKEPRGCIIQAWSYAELLRSYYEDILPKMIE